MKRTLTAVIALFLLCSVSGCALTKTDKEKIEYKPVEGGYALYRYEGSSQTTSFTLPDTYEGQSVVGIMDFALANAEYLESIRIGKNVVTIGEWGVVNCPALREIKIDLKNPEFCDINGVLFNKDKTVLLSYPSANAEVYTIPDTVTALANNAFYQCKNLKKVTFNDALITIGDKAFIKCGSLENVTLPKKLQTIGTDAFSYCEKFTEITIPASVTNIGDYAFFSRAGLMDKIVIKRTDGSGVTFGKDWMPIKKDTVNTEPELIFEP